MVLMFGHFLGPRLNDRGHVVIPVCVSVCCQFQSETAEQNSMKLVRKQDLNVFYQVCVFGADRKTKMAAWHSDWLKHFHLLPWNR